MSTPYHAKYFTHQLTRQGAAGGSARLSQAIFNASVDLNLHQIEAAHFALRSPLSKGVLLTNEVGFNLYDPKIDCGLDFVEVYELARDAFGSVVH